MNSLGIGTMFLSSLSLLASHRTGHGVCSPMPHAAAATAQLRLQEDLLQEPGWWTASRCCPVGPTTHSCWGHTSPRLLPANSWERWEEGALELVLSCPLCNSSASPAEMLQGLSVSALPRFILQKHFPQYISCTSSLVSAHVSLRTQTIKAPELH